jgi:hypothetical protein
MTTDAIAPVDNAQLARDGFAPLHVEAHAELWREQGGDDLLVYVNEPATNGGAYTVEQAHALMVQLAGILAAAERHVADVVG